MLDELGLGFPLGFIEGQKMHRFLEALQVSAVKVLLWIPVDEC